MVESEGLRVVAISAIDNLVKGASGQAIQNMNLMCGLNERMAWSGPGCFHRRKKMLVKDAMTKDPLYALPPRLSVMQSV